MTYDELLKYIDDKLSWENGTETGFAYSALRAVVELHKPDSNGICEACDGECWGCGEWGCEWPKCDCDCHPLYPCDTMQAIEKELG